MCLGSWSCNKWVMGPKERKQEEAWLKVGSPSGYSIPARLEYPPGEREKRVSIQQFCLQIKYPCALYNELCLCFPRNEGCSACHDHSMSEHPGKAPSYLLAEKKGTEMLTGLTWVVLLGTDINILRAERDTWISSPASIRWDCTAVHLSIKAQQV